MDNFLYMDSRSKLSAAILIFIVLIATQVATVLAATPEADADTELAAGHFQAACDLYKLALATHRSDAQLLLKAAKSYESAGDLDEAIHRAREAAVFEPNNAEAHLMLGHYLDLNRDYTSAILHFEVVLDTKNAKAETRKAAYGPLLRMLKHENEMAKLLKRSRQGARDFAQDADSHYNYAWALTQMQNTDPKATAKFRRDAIFEYRKCIELGEKRAGVHFSLATVLADAGEKAEAKEELAIYLKSAPDQANAAEVKALSGRLGDH
jgi:tetratricopeptide (TPR) repeat protein